MNQDELKVLEERIKANPKSRSFLQLAEAYIEIGRRAEALELLRRGEEYYPYYLAARITYGRLLREEEDLDKAIEQFEFVNRTIPDNLVALKNLSHLYTNKNRIAEARTAANSVLTLSPNDPEILDLLETISDLEKQEAATKTSPPSAEPQEEPVVVPPLFPEPSPPEEASEPLPVEAVAEFPMEPVAETIAHPPEVHEEATTPGPASIPVDHEVAELPVEETGAEVQEAPASLSQDETPTLETGLPKTETMGDLLFDQGHSEEALSVYEGALEKDPASQTLPEKIRTVKMVLRMIPSDEPEKAPILASEPVTPEEASPEPEPEVLTAEKPAGPPEPEAEPVAAAPAPLAAPSRKECRKESSAHTLPERIIEMVSSRMGRDLLGYLLSTCDGLPVEATDSGHWADVLAADGVEIIRTVADMTRQLGWGEFHGTIVWLDRAILYGVPIEGDRALFLVLKPESNIGLCRLLVSRATKGPETDGA